MTDISVARVVEWLTRLVQIPSVGPENAGPRSGPSSEAALAAALLWNEALSSTR